MATTEVKVRMQQRRDTASSWTASNPTLLNGEFGYETDTGKFKVGDGSTAWTSLAYIPGFSVSSYPLSTADIANDAITADKLANTSVIVGTYRAADITVDAQGRITSAANGSISTSEIEDDAVTADKLANTSVTAGSYTAANITVDAQGRVTSASDGAVTGITVGDTSISVTDTGSDGTITFDTDGVERAEFGATEVVFNDSGADVDFRIEGDTDANLLFVEAGNDRVGIGTNTPVDQFHVVSGDTVSTSDPYAGILIENSGGTQGDGNYGPGIVLSKINSNRPGAVIASKQTSSDADQLGIAILAHEEAASSNNVVERFEIDHEGNVRFGSNGTNDSVHIAPSAYAQFDRRQDTGFGFVRLNSSQNGIRIGNNAGTVKTSLDYDGGANFGSGYVTLNGNQIGGIQVTIADDAFATITPPRIGGGWVFLTTKGNNAFPGASQYASAYLDWGNSPQASAVSGGGDVATSLSGPPNGTTGTDGKLTVFVGGTSGKLYIENRIGNSATFQLTFM